MPRAPRRTISSGRRGQYLTRMVNEDRPMIRKKEFIVLCGQIVGSGPFETEYSWNGSRFADRKAAIAEGFKVRRSDDFNIGVVRGRKLLSLDWMEKSVEHDP